jgi:Phospholipase_D-nuclease N-terminal/Short C-terminal domain
MAIATDYPFLNVLWTIMIFFAWVAYLWLLIVIFTDIFRRRDIGGWAKAAWCVFMIVLPFVGVLSYLILQHDGIAKRNVERAQQAQTQMDAYVKSVAGQDGAASEIDKAKKLLDNGTINQAEFDALKAKALAAH